MYDYAISPIFWIIYLALALWVADTQAKKRQIKYGWSIFWCLILGPLWGWVVIAATCSRKGIPGV